MAVPTLVQITPLISDEAYDTARTLTFPAGITAGNTVVVCGGFANNGVVTSLTSVVASVSMAGVVFLRRADRGIRGSNSSGITLWTGDKVAAGATAITVTPGIQNNDNYCAFFAMEFAGTTADAFEGVVGADADHGAFSLDVGPMPAAGSLSQVDTLAVYASFLDMGGIATTSQGWTVPAGWTELVTQNDPTGAQKPFAAGYKTQTAQTAITVTTNSAQADLYGRVAILFVLRGVTGAPAPTPPPPPPPPGPSPGPAPAPQAVKVQGVQPEVAGLTAINVEVYTTPTSRPILGTFLFSTTTAAFSASLESGNAVMYITIPNPLPGGGSIVTGTSVVVIGQKVDGTGGFRGGVSGVVVNL